LPPRNPLVGYNDNLEHRGQIYHVQTEDSGVRRPHVITHLFADGGRIITTIKTSYADIVGQADQEAQVRHLMRSQHRGMMASLRDGELDAKLDGAGSPVAVAAPGSPAATPATAAAAPSAAATPVADAAASAALDPSTRASQQDIPIELTTPAPTAANELDRAADTAEVGLLHEVKAPPRPIPAAVTRKATPPTAGSYRIVSKGPEPPSTPPAGGPPGMPPPRKRRYPQTNPGRLRADGRSKGGDPARGGGDAGGLGVGPLPMPGGFGARFISDRSFDEVLLELLAQLEQL
jgi:hypothetical protein